MHLQFTTTKAEGNTYLWLLCWALFFDGLVQLPVRAFLSCFLSGNIVNNFKAVRCRDFPAQAASFCTKFSLRLQTSLLIPNVLVDRYYLAAFIGNTIITEEIGRACNHSIYACRLYFRIILKLSPSNSFAMSACKMLLFFCL